MISRTSHTERIFAPAMYSISISSIRLMTEVLNIPRSPIRIMRLIPNRFLISSITTEKAAASGVFPGTT
jgi:hypothetical protein